MKQLQVARFLFCLVGWFLPAFQASIFCLFVPLGDEAERIVFLEGFRLDRFTGNELGFLLSTKSPTNSFVPKSFG